MSLATRMASTVIGLGAEPGQRQHGRRRGCGCLFQEPGDCPQQKSDHGYFSGPGESFPRWRTGAACSPGRRFGGAGRILRQVHGKSAAQIKAHWAKIIFTGRGQPPEDVSNSIEVKKLLARNPHVIGYIEKNMADGSVRVLLSE